LPGSLVQGVDPGLPWVQQAPAVIALETATPANSGPDRVARQGSE
jgi:hypothetical protein